MLTLKAGNIEKTYDSATKTLNVKWKLDGYLQLKEASITSNVFTTDQNPDQWSLEIKFDCEQRDNKGYMSVYLLKGDENKAKVDFKFTMGDVTESAFYNFYRKCSTGFSKFASHDEYKDSLTNDKDLELVVEITYLVNFDQLTVSVDHEKNALNVNWTINNFKQRHNKPVNYCSDLFIHSDFSLAKFQLRLNGSKLTLMKVSEENLVNIIATLKVNGSEKSSQPRFDYSTIKPDQDGISWGNLINTTNIHNFNTNYLTFEVTILFQVIEDTNKTTAAFNDNYKLFKSSEYSDFKINVQGDDGAVVDISVHRNILAPRWPYFVTMLNAGLDEAKNNAMLIADFDLTTVKNMLKYLYYRSVPASDVNSALNLLKIAHRYELTDLFELCEQFICTYLNVDCVISTLIASNIYESKKLVDACKEVFEKEAKPLVKYPNYLNLKSAEQFEIWKMLFDSVFVKE